MLAVRIQDHDVNMLMRRQLRLISLCVRSDAK